MSVLLDLAVSLSIRHVEAKFLDPARFPPGVAGTGRPG
jgi:hypothetical protein